MALEELLLTSILGAISSIVTGGIVAVVFLRFIRREHKGQQIKDYFTSIGIKNLRIKDFENLSDDALRKALTFFTTMHQATKPNPMMDMMSQMQSMAAMSQMATGGFGKIPSAGQPTTP